MWDRGAGHRTRDRLCLEQAKVNRKQWSPLGCGYFLGKDLTKFMFPVDDDVWLFVSSFVCIMMWIWQSMFLYFFFYKLLNFIFCSCTVHTTVRAWYVVSFEHHVHCILLLLARETASRPCDLVCFTCIWVWLMHKVQECLYVVIRFDCLAWSHHLSTYSNSNNIFKITSLGDDSKYHVLAVSLHSVARRLCYDHNNCVSVSPVFVILVFE